MLLCHSLRLISMHCGIDILNCFKQKQWEARLLLNILASTLLQIDVSAGFLNPLGKKSVNLSKVAYSTVATSNSHSLKEKLLWQKERDKGCIRGYSIAKLILVNWTVVWSWQSYWRVWYIMGTFARVSLPAFVG